MLSENIQAIRKARGLSQEELAAKLNVVRQTISKWEKGLSAPDADMLMALSAALETPVSVLLGEAVPEAQPDGLQALSDRLDGIARQMARRRQTRRNLLHWSLIALCAAVVAVFIALIVMDSPYLNWDYHDPETAVMGTALHALEWLFVRLAPFVLTAAAVGAFLTRKRK